MSEPKGPFVGPRPFEREDAAYFFGRDFEVRDLICMVVAHDSVLLYAQSGAGKTSLMNAKLAPALLAENFDVLPYGRVRGRVPDFIAPAAIRNIYAFHALLSWSSQKGITPEQSAGMTIAEFLKKFEERPRVLIFDQFEELFTSSPQRWQDRGPFFEQVAEALDQNPRLRVVFALREDHLAQLDSYARLLPRRLKARYRLERLRKEAALEAVEGPVNAAGRTFAKCVAEKLVDDLLSIRVETEQGGTETVPGEFVEPVQLQVVCDEVWRGLPQDVREIEMSHLVEVGGVDHALAGFYERSVAEASVAAQLPAREIFEWVENHLITPAGTRGTVYKGKDQTGRLANSAVGVLESLHLIRSEWRAGSQWYELTHDRFIVPIQDVNGRLRMRVLLWSAPGDAPSAVKIRAQIESEGLTVLSEDELRAAPGEPWQNLAPVLEGTKGMVVVATPNAVESKWLRRLWFEARQHGIPVFPVQVGDWLPTETTMPRWMRKSPFYHWQRDWRRMAAELKTARPATPPPYLAPEVPSTYVPRTLEMNQSIEILVDAQGNPTGRTVALVGPGGSGKTSAAASICRDGRIRQAYDDGILWAHITNNPADITTRLVDWIELLGGKRAGISSSAQAIPEVRRLLAHRDVLVVVDDVVDASDLEPFNQAAPGAGKLITTRDRQVAARVLAAPVSLGVMDHGESQELLGNWVGNPSAEEKERLADLAHRLGGLPLALELAGAMLRRQVDSGIRLGDALDYLNEALANTGVAGLAAESGHPAPAVFAGMGATIELLEPALRQRFTELAVFPEDTAVPVSDLAALWGVRDFEARTLAMRLDELSLVDYDAAAGKLRIHDLLREFLLSRAPDLTSLNARLVDAWGDLYRLPTNYAWRHIASHLANAGRVVRLRELLMDFAWIQAKLEATDARALISDYSLLPENREVVSIQRALLLSSHVITADKNELAGQLTGRLLDANSKSIRALVEAAAHWQGSLWLRPLTPMLTPPGGPLVGTLKGHRGTVAAVAVFGGGKLVLSGSADHTLRIWEIDTGVELRSLEGHQAPIYAVKVTADARRAVSGDSSGVLKYWDLSEGKPLSSFQAHDKAIDPLALSPDGRLAISGGADGALQVWDLEQKGAARVLDRASCEVVAVAVLPDGKRVLSATRECALQIWDLETGKNLRTFQPANRKFRCMAVASSGDRVIYGCENEPLRAWTLDTRDESELTRDRVTGLNDMVLTPDERHAVTASGRRALEVWNLENGSRERILTGHSAWVRAVDGVPRTRTFVSGSSDHTLKIWDLAARGVAWRERQHRGWIRAVVFTRDGQRAITTSEDRTAALWDVAARSKLLDLKGHKDWVRSAAITEDSLTAITASADATLKVWDLETGAEQRTLEGHVRGVMSVALLDQDRCISAGMDRTLRLWNFREGKELARWEAHAAQVRGVAAAGATRAVSCSTDKTIRVWNLERGSEICVLKGHTDEVAAVALTSDGRRLASVGFDSTVRLWDLAKGALLWTATGHADQVWSVAISAGGEYVLSGSSDQTLTLWDLESGERVAAYTAEAPVGACASAPDGLILAGDGLGHLHYLMPAGPPA